MPSRPGYSAVTCMARMFSRILSWMSVELFGSGGWQTSVSPSVGSSSVAGASGSTATALASGEAPASTCVDSPSSWMTRA